ncbi:MAG: succinate dehydrogenase/fumarate reductase iron-sulfur subunit [Betaproteobacteria bacterium]|nr:succinate dehydrogenase/fumarate reductase iron-sulfur subunit [Betaproteobacteria bacterium]
MATLITAEIQRFDPSHDSEPRFERFEVQGDKNMRVLDVVRSIYETQAPDLAYQFACRIGRCGTCGVRVNGVPVLACQESSKPFMRIEPLSPFRVIRDLVIDRAEVEDRYASLHFAPKRNKAHPREAEPVEPALAEEICHMDRCITCMVCVSACPAVKQRAFDGPAFMLKLRQMAKHPADHGHRLEQALEGGLLECFGCDLCTQLCPTDLDPAGAIREFRRELLLGRGRK